MRDFYALVRCIANNMEDEVEQRRLLVSIERNFGGLPTELAKVFFSLLFLIGSMYLKWRGWEGVKITFL
jgi:hypothetical protein